MSWPGRIFRQALPYLGAAAGGWFGGPAGAMSGFGLGQGISSQLPRSNQNRLNINQQSGRYNVEPLPSGRSALEKPLYSPEDEAAFGQMRTTGLEALRNLPQAEFGPIKEEMQRQYMEQVLPNIMEQFRGGDALQSSGFQQTLGSAATGLQSKLAAAEQIFNQQRRAQEQGYGLNLLNRALQRKYDTDIIGPDEDSFFGSLAEGVAPSLGAYGISSVGDLGDSISKLFEYFSGNKAKETGVRQDKLKDIARLIAYKKLKEQASLQPGNEGY